MHYAIINTMVTGYVPPLSLFLKGLLLRTVSSEVRRVGRSAAHLVVGPLVYLVFVEVSALLSLCPKVHGVRVHH